MRLAVVFMSLTSLTACVDVQFPDAIFPDEDEPISDEDDVDDGEEDDDELGDNETFDTQCFSITGELEGDIDDAVLEANCIRDHRVGARTAFDLDCFDGFPRSVIFDADGASVTMTCVFEGVVFATYTEVGVVTCRDQAIFAEGFSEEGQPKCFPRVELVN